jgi:hypothetical protein
LENIVRVQRPAFDPRIDGVDELVRLFSDEDACLAMLSRVLFGHLCTVDDVERYLARITQTHLGPALRVIRILGYELRQG